jgi:hypothetical protein
MTVESILAGVIFLRLFKSGCTRRGHWSGEMFALPARRSVSGLSQLDAEESVITDSQSPTRKSSATRPEGACSSRTPQPGLAAVSPAPIPSHAAARAAARRRGRGATLHCAGSCCCGHQFVTRWDRRALPDERVRRGDGKGSAVRSPTTGRAVASPDPARRPPLPTVPSVSARARIPAPAPGRAGGRRMPAGWDVGARQ